MRTAPSPMDWRPSLVIIPSQRRACSRSSSSLVFWRLRSWATGLRAWSSREIFAMILSRELGISGMTSKSCRSVLLSCSTDVLPWWVSWPKKLIQQFAQGNALSFDMHILICIQPLTQTDTFTFYCTYLWYRYPWTYDAQADWRILPNHWTDINCYRDGFSETIWMELRKHGKDSSILTPLSYFLDTSQSTLEDNNSLSWYAKSIQTVIENVIDCKLHNISNIRAWLQYAVSVSYLFSRMGTFGLF